jgi:TRAP-type mannitol/chloroaromatic compound transport system permease small subunit
VLRVARVIDRLSDLVGELLLWLVALVVLIGSVNAILRYLGRFTGTSLSPNSAIEMQWYLFSLIFLLGAGYALRQDAHVRVDVLYVRGSPRTRAWIDLLGTLLLLIPFCVTTIFLAWPAVAASWRVREGSPDPGGLPRYPIKSVILLGFGLLLLQGIAEALKRIAFLRGDATAAVPAAHPPEGA